MMPENRLLLIRSVLFVWTLCCAALGEVSAQDPVESDETFLQELLEAESSSKFLSTPEGTALSAQNLLRRNSAVNRWSSLYLHRDLPASKRRSVTAWSTISGASWYQTDLGDLWADDSFIKTNEHSMQVRVYGKTVVDGLGPVVEVLLNNGERIIGAKIADTASEVVIKSSAQAEEVKIQKADIKEITAEKGEDRAMETSGAILRRLSGAKGLEQWKAALSRFAEGPPPWDSFTINERDRVIGYYRLAVEDLSSSLAWDYPYRTDQELTSLGEDMLRLPDGKDPQSAEILQVGTHWNQLMLALSTAPEPRKGPVPEGGGEPPTLSALTPDEIAEQIRGSVIGLQSKLSNLAAGDGITTDLEPLVDRLAYLHRYRQSVEREEAVPLLEAFKIDQSKFVTLFASFAALGSESSQDARNTALQQLNEHWALMQDRVAQSATLRTRIQECSEYRGALLTALGTALNNNRVPLLESCALQLGRRLAGAVESWDAANRRLSYEWDAALWSNGDSQVGRTESREVFAGSLATTLEEITQPLNSETLLQERGFQPQADGALSFSTRSVSLDDIVNQYRQQLGMIPADNPVRISATAHRLTLHGNDDGSQPWHFQNAAQLPQTLILFVHELAFRPGLTIEVDSGCRVFIVAHRIVGDDVPTVILKEGAMMSVFCSEIPQIPRTGTIVGPGKLLMIAGAANTNLQNPPHAAWEWLAGPIPALKTHVARYWADIWRYYLDRFLLSPSISAEKTRIVYIDLLDLPRTAFDSSIDVSSIDASTEDYRKRRFDSGTIEHVFDSNSGRTVPIFVNADLLDGDGRVYLLPDEIVLIPDDTGKLGQWVVVESDQRQLRIKAKGVSSAYGQTRGVDVIRSKFGQNVDVIPIQQSPDFQLVCIDGGGMIVEGETRIAGSDGAELQMAKMGHRDLIAAWTRWTTGDLPKMQLQVRRRAQGDSFLDVRGAKYELPVEFRSVNRPNVSYRSGEGVGTITNGSPFDVRLEYLIQESDGRKLFYDLANTALKPQQEIEVPIFQGPEPVLSAVTDIRATEPFDLFSMRGAFGDIVTYSIGLEGLLGARFPNAALEPGRGAMIDHEKSIIRIESRRKGDVDDKWDTDGSYFSGTWDQYFHRGDGRADASRYSFLARVDQEVRLVLNCVPHYGGTFVNPDNSYQVVLSLAEPLDLENVKNANREWFQRKIRNVVADAISQ